jgi:predicted enzyme related to lactoylglutathione lyase
MVTRDTAWHPGTPCWVDLSVDDAERASTFYAGLFGWDVEIDPDPNFGGHGNFSINGKSVAGVSPNMEKGMPSAWATFLASDDIERTAGKITSAGGQLVTEIMDIGEHGRMLVASDPAGAVFGVWQSGLHTGVRLANENNTLTWNENLSLDYEGNKKFYTEVFGYEYNDMGDDGFSYSTLELNGGPVGGIGELAEESAMPAHWMSYFAVVDTDASVAKALELGGTVLKSAFDTPQGRIAILADDQGAAFALVSVPAEN